MAKEALMDAWHGSTVSRPRRIIDARSIFFNHLSESIQNLGGFIHEWTPFLLVMSYFVFSTCLYMFCTEQLISIFWYIYLTTNFYIAGSTVLEAVMSLEPTREAWRAAEKVQEKGWVFPTPDKHLPLLDLLIVAYLPNEQDIIMDRVHYALDEIQYPKHRIRVNLIYNTPYPIEPLETSLQNLTLRKHHLRVFKVPGSKSKADNLNYFFSLKTDSDITTIFDADHYTHPYGPRWAAERFISDHKVSIVQGRCVIFNTKVSWLASMIAVEFDKIYAVSHPGRASLFGFALFTGSNGYWRTPLLQDLKMDGTVLTEDIDSSLRALSHGCKIVHDLNVVSYELAPTSIPAMWKQRLRWAQGWTQVSMKHLALTCQHSTQGHHRDFTMRFGLLSILLIREFSYYLVTQYCCLVLSIILTQFPQTPVTLARFVFFPFPVSVWFFIISIICLIATLWMTARIRSEFITRWMVIMFAIIYTPYLVFNATMGLYGHARQVVRYTKWNPTKRT